MNITKSWTGIFGRKQPIPTVHHNFLESIYSEITKNLYYVLSPVRAKYPFFGAPAHGLLTSSSGDRNMGTQNREVFLPFWFTTSQPNSFYSRRYWIFEYFFSLV